MVSIATVPTLSSSTFSVPSEDDGTGRMTQKRIRELCLKNHGYSTPDLNESLYLHFQGYTQIENLEAYTGVRCLWLESNALSEVRGIATLKELRSLYLHQNCLKEIGADAQLSSLPHLQALNLADNFIADLGDSLAGCIALRTLNLSNNHFSSAALLKASLAPLGNSLEILDLRGNRLDGPPEEIMDFLQSMPHISCLYLSGNEVTRKIVPYRKSVIAALKNLKYLDDRPVSDDERRLAEAFAVGGKEGEEAERAAIAAEAKAAEAKRLQSLRDMQARAASAAPRTPPGPTLYYKLNHPEEFPELASPGALLSLLNQGGGHHPGGQHQGGGHHPGGQHQGGGHHPGGLAGSASDDSLESLGDSQSLGNSQCEDGISTAPTVSLILAGSDTSLPEGSALTEPLPESVDSTTDDSATEGDGEPTGGVDAPASLRYAWGAGSSPPDRVPSVPSAAQASDVCVEDL